MKIDVIVYKNIERLIFNKSLDLSINKILISYGICYNCQSYQE